MIDRKDDADRSEGAATALFSEDTQDVPNPLLRSRPDASESPTFAATQATHSGRCKMRALVRDDLLGHRGRTIAPDTLYLKVAMLYT